MFTTKELQNKIADLKKSQDICILAHSYQTHDILEIADYSGDSYALSKIAAKLKNRTILMCGVRFMAETVKILSPDKKVILSHPDAGCPMAEQITADELRKLREAYPNHAVVAYINTTAELKCLCDVCVTSSSALNVVKNIPEKDILFIPDCNLGSWIENKVPEKNFRFIKGGCPVHMQITEDDVIKARKSHPDALLLVHPECVSSVTSNADFAGSTAEIIDYASKSDCMEFIIGTDNTIVSHLQFAHPEKKFYALSKNCICKDMRLTTLYEVYNCLIGNGGEEIILSDETIENARKPIDAMIKYSV